MKSRKVWMITLAVVSLLAVGAWMMMRASRDSEHKEEAEHAEKEGHEHEENEGQDEHGEEHEESEEEVSMGGVGPGNAVTAADEHDGIKLSPRAVQTMGVELSPYEGCPVPDNALVFYQDKVGVYRLRDGWIKLISIPHGSDELSPGDLIVTEGVGLVRAAELDAFSEETGHSH